MCRSLDVRPHRQSSRRTAGFRAVRGPEQYAKFHDPIVIEPADCRQAAKTGQFKLGGKDYTGTIKLSEYLMGTIMDWTIVDSGEGTYVWDYSQDACPDTLVSLYRGGIKVLTNSTASFTDGTAIVAGRDKNQVPGLELKETMILCGRGAQTTHIKTIAVFFHPMEQIEVASGKFNMVTTEAEFTRFESELSFLQVRSTMTLQETIRHVKAEICEDRKQIAHVPGSRGTAKDSHQLHQRDSGDPQWDKRVRCTDQLRDQGGGGASEGV